MSVSTDAACEGIQVGTNAQTLLVERPEPHSCGEVDPLYLFACQLQWRKWCDEEAGWELLAALTSSDAPTRIVASSLLHGYK